MSVRRLVIAAGVVVAGISLAGCVPSGPTVATFQVAGDQTYKIELATPELIAHAKELLAGTTEEGRIPVGRIVRDDPSVNEPWSWHIDPATLEFADATTEVCDGLPEYVEDGTLTSDYYCPWIAEVIAIEGPGA
ncbi:BP74-related protein [Schumannella luteola]